MTDVVDWKGRAEQAEAALARLTQERDRLRAEHEAVLKALPNDPRDGVDLLDRVVNLVAKVQEVHKSLDFVSGLEQKIERLEKDLRMCGQLGADAMEERDRERTRAEAAEAALQTARSLIGELHALERESNPVILQRGIARIANKLALAAPPAGAPTVVVISPFNCHHERLAYLNTTGGAMCIDCRGFFPLGSLEDQRAEAAWKAAVKATNHLTGDDPPAGAPKETQG